MATWPLASAVRGTVRAERTQTDTGGHSHRHSPVHPRRHKPKGNIPHGSRKRGRGGTKPGAHRPTDAHAQTETKVRGERTFAGLGAAAKVSGRRTGSLTPGSAGTLAHGPEGGRAPLPPPPAGRLQLRASLSVPLAAGRRTRGHRPQHHVQPARPAVGPRTSTTMGRERLSQPQQTPRHRRQGWGPGRAGCGQDARRPGASPGHTVVQAVFWKAWPSQKAPPLSGAGLVHVRVRFCQPRPQRLEQGDHSAQLDQPPFTARAARVSWSAWLCGPWVP